MRIAVDANLLLRAVVRDDPAQARTAIRELTASAGVVLPIVALCEFAWVLRSSYGFPRETVAAKIREVTRIGGVICDQAAVDAGLKLMEVGGDFADGVVAHMGEREGAEVFVSFDRKAVRHLLNAGLSARLAGKPNP